MLSTSGSAAPEPALSTHGFWRQQCPSCGPATCGPRVLPLLASGTDSSAQSCIPHAEIGKNNCPTATKLCGSVLITQV